ncbi:hypothetical protein [Paenibacillus sp.]|uniref:hypothetical protein n=1 Tax=Paenibacillus sp. TaxID=58172 RepID=UPI0028124F2C|nr:hypothetical protein [Paenibacillus sp.]
MNGIAIEDDYAGGNIRVVSEESGVVTLEQQLRDTTGWWFYWGFAAIAVEARTVTFEFANGEVIGPWGPAYSRDGIEWTWLGVDASRSSRASFAYAFEAGEKAYFSYCIPYQLHHFESFYARMTPHPLVRRKVLAVSERLRALPLLVAGDDSASRHILIACRQHACEAVSGYAMEGFLEHCLQSPHSRLLTQCKLHYVPFVDLDGAERGDQGKGRAPHDHNRDYTDRPLYRSTAALMAYASAFPLEVGIDFHSPYLWGGRNDRPFIVKRRSPMKEEIERFGALLVRATSRSEAAANELRYDGAHDIEAGEDWNQPNDRTCSSFFERRGARLAFSFELPYFGVEGGAVTPHSCRRFGADFAAALEAYVLGGGRNDEER